MKKVIVIGGGASGLMAAYGAAKAGNLVTLLEKNEKLGKKIYITGKGRCNVTNCAPREEFFNSVLSNPKFFFSAFSVLSNEDLCELLETNGCPLKTERGQRVFPVSDHASDITKTLERMLRHFHVDIHLQTEVQEIYHDREKVFGVKTSRGDFYGDDIILATGGLSYPLTGSTGDGYKFLEEMGMNIQKCYPSLTSLRTKETFVRDLAGLTLKNITLKIFDEKKTYYKDFGELLFTHQGISGPLCLSASARITDILGEGKHLHASIDLKPALDEKTLDVRLLEDFLKDKNKQLSNVLTGLLPRNLISPYLEKVCLLPDRVVNSITKDQRHRMIQFLKDFPLEIMGTGDFSEAVVTKGGLSVKEVNPKTMECKKMKHLFVTGELLDLDALTGGFNLQIAWSTGYLAGISTGREES